ncbi:DNA repair and recombination protein rad54b [Cymbomonas tetramitiformis]|uniref:DNA repair and recombination protein rad54b n=1 Tax=Cymbomonas tetramitiformis TaxID=36881 RepID=A0AAE0LFN4_9CHLO|nr:DNA repair and recombination protein rad54b [Cymbomonas tetramitiformis]
MGRGLLFWPRQEITNTDGIFSSGQAALGAILKLRKVCNSPELLQAPDGDLGHQYGDPSSDAAGQEACPRALTTGCIEDAGKLAVLRRMLHSMQEIGDRVILVSGFTSMINLLQTFCQKEDISFSRLDGSTAPEQRVEIVKRFNQGLGGEVFLLSRLAGGAGLNLVGANRLVLFDSDWNPAHDQQAMARVWRDGQTKPVVIYRMLSTGTIEEKMFQRQLLKSEVSDCMGFSSGELTECSFSHGELRDVFTFNPDSTCDTQELLHRQHQTASSMWQDVSAHCGDVPLERGLLEGNITYICKLDAAPDACCSSNSSLVPESAGDQPSPIKEQIDIEEEGGEASTGKMAHASLRRRCIIDDDDDDDGNNGEANQGSLGAENRGLDRRDQGNQDSDLDDDFMELGRDIFS